MTTPVLPFDDRFVDLSPTAGTTELDYDFELKSEAGLVVVRIRAGARLTLVNGTDYDFLTGLGNETGGTITLTSASLAADRYLLVGLEPIERASDLIDSQSFSGARYNEDGDLNTIFAQELRRDVDRSIKSDFGQSGLLIDTSLVTSGKVLMRGEGDDIVPGPDATDIAAAQANAAAAAADRALAETAAATAVNATQFTYVGAGGTISGVGPYDMGVAIGSEKNLFLTIGNLPQSFLTYTVSGTTFTLNSVDGIDGLPWEGRITGNVRALNAPADGSVERPALGSALTAEIDDVIADLEDTGSPNRHRMEIHGIKPDKLDTNRLYLYEGTVYSADGTIFVHNPSAYTIDMTTIGVGGKDTATPISAPSPGGLYDYFVYCLRRDSDGAFGAVVSNAKFYGDVVVPAGYTMVRKLRFGFRYNASWDGIPNHDATHWPWPSVRLTDAQASSVWRALNAGAATTNTLFSLANWIPDNARQVSVLVHVTTGGSVGTAYIKTPGVTGEIAIPGILNSTVALIIPKIRINSLLELEYRCTAGQTVSVFVLEYFMTEPS